MKVETRMLSEGRIAFTLCENDGSVIATRELECDAAASLFAQWAVRFISSTKGTAVTFVGENGPDVEVRLCKKKSDGSSPSGKEE